MVPYSSIGAYKTYAVRELLSEFTNILSISPMISRIEEIRDFHYQSNNIFIAAIDSMSARRYMFEKFIEKGASKSIFIDTRISAEYWEVYAVVKENQANIERYRETLFDDSQGNIGACNYQQSSHSAAGAAIQGVELITNYLNNILIEDDYLPFKCSKDLRTQNYNVTY